MHRQRHSLILRNWILIFHVDIFLCIVNYGKFDHYIILILVVIKNA
jgi:hypothetical protein